MFDDMQESVSEFAQWFREDSANRNTMRLIAFANSDLYQGPGALQFGEWIPIMGVDPDSPWRRLDFAALCDSISRRLDSICDLESYRFDYDDETGDEIEWTESLDGSREAILRELCGAELIRHI